jgi:uncharacterized phage protein (TIGR01671 family)
MREIFFRAKRKDNGEWAYGFLTKMWGALHIIDKANENVAYEIIPETVGQYSGLFDNDGKTIFEGDIVKEWSSSWKSPLKTEMSVYEVVCEYLGSLHLIRKTRYGEVSTLLCRKSVVVVIGNIYDNPELLEEKQ